MFRTQAGQNLQADRNPQSGRSQGTGRNLQMGSNSQIGQKAQIGRDSTAAQNPLTVANFRYDRGPGSARMSDPVQGSGSVRILGSARVPEDGHRPIRAGPGQRLGRLGRRCGSNGLEGGNRGRHGCEAGRFLGCFGRLGGRGNRRVAAQRDTTSSSVSLTAGGSLGARPGVPVLGVARLGVPVLGMPVLGVLGPVGSAHLAISSASASEVPEMSFDAGEAAGVRSGAWEHCPTTGRLGCSPGLFPGRAAGLRASPGSRPPGRARHRRSGPWAGAGEVSECPSPSMDRKEPHRC